jgi:hypothetical protein
MENQETQEQQLPEGFELVDIQATKFKHPEWVFQFDNDEPVVFAWCEQEEDNPRLSFNLKAETNSTLFFKSPGGKTFKIFSREITEPTLKMLEQNIIIK